MENTITKKPDGILRKDGNFVVNIKELPNGYEETRRVGKLRIRGEKEPRTISYADYAKLAGFYGAQERLIKDRKYIMVTLENGAIVNTADITSLEHADEVVFAPKVPKVDKRITDLPTRRIMLGIDGKIISDAPTRRQEQAQQDKFILADCHYDTDESGNVHYYTALDTIPNAEVYRPCEDGYSPVITQFYRYGIPQLGGVE